MKTNIKEKNISVEEFFKGQGIQPGDKLLSSNFSNSLREKVHSLYLVFTDQKMKWLIAKKKLLLFGGGLLAFIFVATALVTLTVPSVRDQVTSTAANLFGIGDKNQEDNSERPEKEETDTEAPELSITSPEDGASIVEAKITISGKTEPGATVFVGESEVENVEGEFSKEVELAIGENKIVVRVKDEAGNENVKTLTIIKAEVTPEPTPVPAKISLSGVAVENGIKLTWGVTNVNTSSGFKILKGSTPNLTYPANGYYKYISTGSTRAYVAPITNGETYYFRVCQYQNNGTCGVYSNSVKVTAPKKSGGAVSSISLSAGAESVSWSVNGYSDMGFKIVWSKTSGPTYPTRGTDQYQYNSSPEARSYSFGDGEAFDGPGTYYVRVCEYLGGKCGVYSN
ncbi:hypothetical protein JW796_02780 [Candidatus Dojkabacteria bacterium]|nr:hypothetical protein [Candidatus Dojkabacteria bacterium]